MPFIAFPHLDGAVNLLALQFRCLEMTHTLPQHLHKTQSPKVNKLTTCCLSELCAYINAPKLNPMRNCFFATCLVHPTLYRSFKT